MKLQILTNRNQAALTGYTYAYLENGQLDLSDISDNSCTSILCDDILNQLDYSQNLDGLKFLCSKLRMGGEIMISGVEPRLLAIAFTNQDITAEEFNNAVYNRKSMIPIVELKSMIAQAGLKIVTLKIVGVNYEFIGSR
jgi:predicted SAM-dependent methyltransferase